MRTRKRRRPVVLRSTLEPEDRFANIGGVFMHPYDVKMIVPHGRGCRLVLDTLHGPRGFYAKCSPEKAAAIIALWIKVRTDEKFRSHISRPRR